jgi:hypothetical protein
MKRSIATTRGLAAMGMVAAMGLIACWGCASHHPSDGTAPLRAPTGVPGHFRVGEVSGFGTSEPEPGMGCRNPLVDPLSGVRITLVRSSGGYGDYEVPDGKYDVGKGEVLRVECATGKAIGIYKRQ